MVIAKHVILSEIEDRLPKGAQGTAHGTLSLRPLKRLRQCPTYSPISARTLRRLNSCLRRPAAWTSAPCRLDVGGTWDLKCFALPYASLNPATTNIAISARTRIRLKAYRPGWVRIVDEFHHEAFPVDALDLTGHFGLLFAIAAHFALGGVEIEIAYGCPPRSGVGGSGTLSVALAGGPCLRARVGRRRRPFAGGNHRDRLQY